MTLRPPTSQGISAPARDDAIPVAAILPPGCDGEGGMMPAGARGPSGCLHHYPPGRNLAAEGCICPAWFDGGGWHLIGQNPACTAHRPALAPADPVPPQEG